MTVKHFSLHKVGTNNESTSNSDLSKHLLRCIAVLLSSEEAPTPPLHSNPIFLLAVWSACCLHLLIRLVKVAEQTSWTLRLLIHFNSARWIKIGLDSRWIQCQRIMDGKHCETAREQPISARWPCLPVTSLTTSSCSDKWAFQKWNLVKPHFQYYVIILAMMSIVTTCSHSKIQVYKFLNIIMLYQNIEPACTCCLHSCHPYGESPSLGLARRGDPAALQSSRLIVLAQILSRTAQLLPTKFRI